MRKEDIDAEYVAILAKLELTSEEREQAAEDMAGMLCYVEQLGELDTEGVEPLVQLFSVENVFREDEITNGDGSKDTLRNAPAIRDGGFKVPGTIGEQGEQTGEEKGREA